jgi:hypothetical protein
LRVSRRATSRSADRGRVESLDHAPDEPFKATPLVAAAPAPIDVRRRSLFRSGEFHMKFLLSGLIAIGLAIVATTSSFAADARNVTVVNETGYAIKFLGFNAPDDGMDEWDNELDKVLQNQTSTYVEFDDDDEGCVWNIRVDWQNYDETVLWKNVNLCKFTALRLRYDSGTKTTSFVAE